MTLRFEKFKAKDERHTFKVTINFRDKFDDKTLEWELPAIKFDEASAEIERFAIFLEKCKNRYPRGKGGLDGFDDIPDYYRYFGEEEESVEIWEKYGVESLWWPSHEGEYPKNLESYSIVYTDQDNQKYKVTM
ncbi:hypothetical protein Asfd1_127 [Aeromonas phage Asfd_1]|nr:hypothetical protein Asfd1_127 [Aeromonas phage Asfd_1]